MKNPRSKSVAGFIGDLDFGDPIKLGGDLVLSPGITVTYSEGCQAAQANRLFSIFAKRVCQVFASKGLPEGTSGFLVSPLEG